MVKIEAQIEANLSPRKKQYLLDFIEFAEQELGIQESPQIVIQADREGLVTTASYNPATHEILVWGGNRALVDIARSTAHEMVHHKQFETGQYQKELEKYHGKIPDIGHVIEDDANAIAGQLIKKFAKQVSTLIYEQEHKKVTPKILADKIIDIWIRRGIDFRDFTRLSVTDIVEKEGGIDGFLDYFVPTLMSHLENGELNTECTFVLPFQDCFLVFESGEHKELGRSLVPSILKGTTRPMGQIDFGAKEWKDFIFDEINEDNLKLLRSKTKVGHVDADYLEHEYPDLCEDITNDYWYAIKKKHANELYLYIVNSIRTAFHKAKKIELVPQEESFIITMDLKEILTSQVFRTLLLGELVESLELYLKNGRDRYLEFYPKKEIPFLQFLFSFTFESIEFSITADMTLGDIIVELCDHELPELDWDKWSTPEGSIDKQIFNNEVAASIIKFFDRRY